ncbi:MAG: hypothetical protein U9Q77_01495 [Candidatus Marinimicrobia bacterium]|nr:hypothetical protein [Candidatus Neomarinimicrobiota bacterium]
MKLLLRITPMVLVILGLFFIIGCEDTEDDPEINPLVGAWDFSNMEQSSVYTAVDSSLIPFYAPGDTVGSGGLTWAEFSAMGVNGTVAMLEDGTFTLDGSFPISNDTLGYAPVITPLTDAGVWTEDVTAGTLLIDGAFYDLGGLMTLSDDEAELTLVYASSEIDTFVLPVDMGGTIVFFPGIALNNASSTTLGFTKQ